MRFASGIGMWRGRLITALIVLAMLILAAVAAFTYLAYQRAATALIVERDQQLAYLSASRLRDELAKFSSELQRLARTPAMSEGSLPERRAALADASNRLKVFDGGVVLLDHFGRVQASQPVRAEIFNHDWSDRDFFRQLLASSELYLSDISMDGPDGTKAVVMSVPVVGASGELVGVLAGMFRVGESTTSSFYASVVRLRLGQSGNTYLTDGSGIAMYDSEGGEVGAPLRLPGLPANALRGAAGALRTHDESGNDVVTAYAPIPGTSWTLVTEDDWVAMTSSVRNYARTLLGLLTLGVLLPPMGVALLVRHQQARLLERERQEQETRVAGMIQKMVIPRQPPTLPGWDLAFYHQLAPGGGRDFHDYMFLPDGRLMLTVGEVNDRGLHAAHIISTTRAALRGASHRMLSPNEALACSNELLLPEISDGTALTCLYVLLNPTDGQICFASAGAAAPCLCTESYSCDGRPVGEPLGAQAETQYEEGEMVLAPGTVAILGSDGIFRAQDAHGEMFGAARVQAALAEPVEDGSEMVTRLVSALKAFSGREQQEQADDITILVLKRLAR